MPMSYGEITAIAILLSGLFAAEARGHARPAARRGRVDPAD
jgi:hypothetical protein